MAITVRPAEDQDIATMADLRAEEWQTTAFWQGRIARYLRGEHSPRQALATRTALVADDDGTVVGFVSGHLTRRYGCDGELQWMNVAREHRGRGIAGLLLQAISGWFVEQRACRICVNVDPKNVPARGLYKNYGAQPMNEQWMVWQDARTMGRRSREVG